MSVNDLIFVYILTIMHHNTKANSLYVANLLGNKPDSDSDSKDSVNVQYKGILLVYDTRKM